ncbi:MAG: leucyl aminopeptidase [Endozoicomonadaceae bacterium]|nr:leucyl aminopeptidase [Endozoicomonadaceae bacterium]MCY4330004.1 leucyl aminopeptidase [Endozoicomonadaceae bacterium]
MEVIVKSHPIENITSSCLVLFININAADHTFACLSNSCNEMLRSLIKRGDLGNKPGKTLHIPLSMMKDIDRILLVSTGRDPVDFKAAIKIIDSTVNALQTIHTEDAIIDLNGINYLPDFANICQYLAQQLIASSYKFSHFNKNTTHNQEPVSDKKLQTVTLFHSGQDQLNELISRGIATGHGINVAKDLGNLPGNVCTPTYLAEEAKSLCSKNSAFSFDALGEKQLKKLNMNAFLSVAKGSVEEGKLIIIEYQGGEKTEAPYVLLGKGITFDAGGISLKPGPKMDEMKYDMCGAASVMGTMTAMAELKPAINVIGVIAAAENLPSGGASKPGDIVTSMSGRTIEILNTDAEGRLVLCDALTYIEQFKPQVVIDIATLTGACIVALGHHMSGLMSNNDKLAEELINTGKSVNDTVWRLPLGELYTKQLESNFADCANIGGPPAGTITAGCFLAQFAETFNWAHLDIAGTAWKSGKEKSATGRPVALLVNYLLSKAV